MAILNLEDGSTLSQTSDIDRELASLKIELQHWPVGEDPQLRALLAQDQLDEQEQNLVLQHLDRYFQQLQAEQGYQARDLIALHPGIPNLEVLLAKFQLAHTHADDEVRYVIAGAGVFGFVRPDGSQVELTVQAGEYINVPAGTEHWFHLTDSLTVKVVRYFLGSSGWLAEYTHTPIRFPAT